MRASRSLYIAPPVADLLIPGGPFGKKLPGQYDISGVNATYTYYECIYTPQYGFCRTEDLFGDARREGACARALRRVAGKCRARDRAE